jgi:hypothetical protein
LLFPVLLRDSTMVQGQASRLRSLKAN